VEELEKINEKQEDQRFDPLPGQTKKGAQNKWVKTWKNSR
jgi:hypothetical protein